MAESTLPPAQRIIAPTLDSTSDATAYIPVSWTAAGAISFAGLYTLLLMVLGLDSYLRKKPLITPELLILPVIAIILSFAARRMIENSEGTRTSKLYGLDVNSTAWWTSVVLGLVYVAYLFGIEYSIRRDSALEVQKWGELVLKDDLTGAFYRTRDPEQRTTIRPDDTAQLEARWRTEYVSFRQTDVIRLLQRNPGRCEFIMGGLKDWVQRPNGVECVYTATIKCPEGTFPIIIPLRAVETGVAAGGGRQWQVIAPTGGFFQKDVLRTPYGWSIADLEQEANFFGRSFIYVSSDRLDRLRAFVSTSKQPMESKMWPLSDAGSVSVMALLGSAGWIAEATSPEFYKLSADQLFRLPGGAIPDATKKDVFLASWSTVGISPAGSRIRESPDVNDFVSFTENAIEVRVPVEIPLVHNRDGAVARGRLVLICDDPATIASSNQLRQESDSANATLSPEGYQRRVRNWKLLAIESDLKPISTRQAAPATPSLQSLGQ